MKNRLTYKELSDLAASHPPPEQFGPDSDFPQLAFDLTGSASELAEWVSSRPCPVIGIGEGELGHACDVVLPDTDKLSIIAQNISAAPITAMVLVQHLRASENLSVSDALIAESFAYATVQTGPEFNQWLTAYQGGSLIPETGPPLITEIVDDTLSIRINRPKNYNAIGIEVRDALCEVLDMALAHGGFTRIELTGTGKTFSIGGAIEEFGEITDPATAHWIRTLRLPARRFAQLKDRLHVHVNGAAVGAGTEIAAFGQTVTASPKAWFQLPELKYGLLPGAGGMVSLPRRIGRQRTAYMALSMEKISAKTALEWGLVDKLCPLS